MKHSKILATVVLIGLATAAVIGMKDIKEQDNKIAVDSTVENPIMAIETFNLSVDGTGFPMHLAGINL